MSGATLPAWALHAASVPTAIIQKRFKDEAAAWRIASLIAGAALAIGAIARAFGVLATFQPGNSGSPNRFNVAMFDCIDTPVQFDSEIAQYDVSEDGINWRPYDPARDTSELLHTRIFFAEPQGC
jgi:hypothetical protein